MNKLSAKMTASEFLAWEREQPTRHHYVGGEIFDLSGGSVRHNRLSVKLSTALDRAVEGGPCGVYSADQKIGIGDELVYADVSVICRPLQFRPGTKDVSTNPVVVVEVQSKSTEAYDRAEKLHSYLSLPSIKHVLLVSQREIAIDLFTRVDDDVTTFKTYKAGTSIHLENPNVTLSLDALYTGIFDLPGDD